MCREESGAHVKSCHWRLGVSSMGLRASYSFPWLDLFLCEVLMAFPSLMLVRDSFGQSRALVIWLIHFPQTQVTQDNFLLSPKSDGDPCNLDLPGRDSHLICASTVVGEFIFGADEEQDYLDNLMIIVKSNSPNVIRISEKRTDHSRRWGVQAVDLAGCIFTFLLPYQALRAVGLEGRIQAAGVDYKTREGYQEERYEYKKSMLIPAST